MYLFSFLNVILIAYHVYAIDAYNRSIMLEKVFFFLICDVLLSKGYIEMIECPTSVQLLAALLDMTQMMTRRLHLFTSLIQGRISLKNG